MDTFTVRMCVQLEFVYISDIFTIMHYDMSLVFNATYWILL